MKRKMLAGVVAVGALAIPAAPASAASAEQACIDAGGTYTKVNGENSCAFPVGNSDNTKTTSQKGSWNSDGGHQEEFTNPGGNQPGGQQGQDTLP
jgi:hypothetical protein